MYAAKGPPACPPSQRRAPGAFFTSSSQRVPRSRRLSLLRTRFTSARFAAMLRLSAKLAERIRAPCRQVEGQCRPETGQPKREEGAAPGEDRSGRRGKLAGSPLRQLGQGRKSKQAGRQMGSRGMAGSLKECMQAGRQMGSRGMAGSL